jgi:predicted  nucleic acid-binding Zn-ribbon protein
MHPSLPHLIELQRLDLRIAELSAQLAAMAARTAHADAPVAAARAELARAKDAHLGNVKERKKFELDVESWKEKARKYRDQTGAVKSNEAYKALVHEIELAESETRKAEDKLLEHMVSGEEYDRQMKAGQKAVVTAEGLAKNEHARIAAEQQRLEQEKAKLTAERESAVGGVPEDLLARYQKLAKRYHGTAIARMVGEACTGCRVHLRPHMVQRVRQMGSEEIVECDSCTRILYYLEEPPAPGGAGTAGGDPVQVKPQTSAGSSATETTS